MYVSLMLCVSLDHEVRPGQFGIVVDNNLLLIPEVLYEVLARLNVQTLQEFISILQQFPTAIAEGLGWTTDEVDSAAVELYGQLRGHVPHDWLEPAQIERQPGAFAPTRSRTE